MITKVLIIDHRNERSVEKSLLRVQIDNRMAVRPQDENIVFMEILFSILISIISINILNLSQLSLGCTFKTMFGEMYWPCVSCVMKWNGRMKSMVTDNSCGMAGA